jgi:Ala-tRNA(Pro) deacylase
MDLYVFLENHQVYYQRFDHPPVYTVAEANRLVPDLPGIHTKNLFLRDKKAKRFFLLVCRDDRSIKLQQLASQLGVSKLSLGSSERLLAVLGVEPGSVSILALVNDVQLRVELVVDGAVWEANAITAHPLVNTTTLVIQKADLERFLMATGHKPLILDLSEQPSG